MDVKALLESVRRARTAAPPAGMPAGAPAAAAARTSAGAPPRDALLGRFADMAAASGAAVHFARGKERLQACFCRILLGMETLTTADPGRIEEILEAPLPDLLPPGLRVLDPARGRDKACFDADASLTPVAGGVAETGSVVLLAGASRSRTASLTAAVHVAAVDPATLVPDLLDLPRCLPATPGSAFLLLTGPSKTADIELKLVTGVHGPGALHLVIPADPVPGRGS